MRCDIKCRFLPPLNFKNIYIYLFIWLCQVLVKSCGIYFPDQGLNPGPLHWELGVLDAGLPEKSLPPLNFTKTVRGHQSSWSIQEASDQFTD